MEYIVDASTSRPPVFLFLIDTAIIEEVRRDADADANTDTDTHAHGRMETHGHGKHRLELSFAVGHVVSWD